ncbi:MAG TPA: helix-turn-helix domain-containing protein [Chthoniobacterales bacterium]
MNRDFLEDRCTLNKVLRIIGKRWVSEVLVLIRNDVRRFSQLKECLAGISDNVLSTVLSELVKEGLIEKQVFGEIPVGVEYKVTGKGRELTDLMSMLCKWGKTHIPFDVRMEPLRRAATAL